MYTIKLDMKKIKRVGFTLIELLVVISIISILTIISVSQFNTAKIKARDTQRKADIDSVSKALNTYFADYGYFPEEGVVAWGEAFVDDNNQAEDYYYMRTMPEEEYLDSGYCYLVDDDNSAYVLLAELEGDESGNSNVLLTEDVCGQSSGQAYNFGLSSTNTTVDSFCGDGTNPCQLLTGEVTGIEDANDGSQCVESGGSCTTDECLYGVISDMDCPDRQQCCQLRMDNPDI